jgi:hypothetical protein
MPEHDNHSDKLERFFQKAASRPDIDFNEEDWKKLEARLNARGPQLSATASVARKLAATIVVTALFVSGIIHWNLPDAILVKGNQENGIIEKNEHAGDQIVGANPARDQASNNMALNETKPAEGKSSLQDAAQASVELSNEKALRDRQPSEYEISRPLQDVRINKNASRHIADESIAGAATNGIPVVKTHPDASSVRVLPPQKINQELIPRLTASAESIKQKALTPLSGAEKVEGLSEEANVNEGSASDDKKVLASPKLSLLLSLAPDFSSTSLDYYSSPGRAFGAMVHYHLKNRWSLAAGLIQNNKKYTGDGEDYQPPKGYWKYYTNGITPQSVDGSCSVLEIPVMVQYTITDFGRSRLCVATGASSYIMSDESYQYSFSEPNPGAKEGWESTRSSRFFFNMINFTVAFEHQIVPGLLLGVEPYFKVPIEKIGWSNLKLYSTGASFTLRYTLINKRTALQTRSRSPD